MQLLPPNDKNREILHRGTQFLDGLAVFQGQRFALAFFLGTPAAAVRALVKARNERGISAVLLDALLDLLIESGNQQIGRASCRERVKIAAAAGRLNRESQETAIQSRWL